MGEGGQPKDHWSIIVERFGSVWIVCQDWIGFMNRFGNSVSIELHENHIGTKKT